jgi:monofunctional biosynthetic peptidoglycan transglycosylase
MTKRVNHTKPKKSGFINAIKRFLYKIFFWFFSLSLFFVVLYRFVPVPFTPLMVIRAIENKAAGKPNHFSHEWRSIKTLSQNLQKAVISSEDGRFLSHNGFDFDAMYKAYKNNNRGNKIKGGSTISQQTAKNVFLWQGRSYFRKALEAYFTVLIELIWTKERIMEVYLNSIEMGDGIYGAEAATQFWYGKNASRLTKNEAAGIAAILPNPRKFKPTENGRKKSKIIRLMKHIKKLEY